MRSDWLESHANEELNLFKLTDYIRREYLTIVSIEFNPITKVVTLHLDYDALTVQLTDERTNIEAYKTIVDAL